jgi:hypothetical protein
MTFHWQDFNAWSYYTRRDKDGHYTQAMVYRIERMDDWAKENVKGSNLALYPGSDPLWLAVNERPLLPPVNEPHPTFIGLFVKLESAKFAVEAFCKKELECGANPSQASLSRSATQ